MNVDQTSVYVDYYAVEITDNCMGELFRMYELRKVVLMTMMMVLAV